jgi:TolB-like protein/class 3 adenylate cyclase
MSEGIQRRLAAILAADVAGYARLMGDDESGTLSALRQLRTERLIPTVASHRGKVIKSMGDGWLVAFASVVDAVTCAIEIQEGLAGHEIIKLRVGVHLGDITHEEEDIFGDGVNIAARLQAIAAPGGIVISDMAQRSVDGKLAAAFVSLGVQNLKNIAEPITVYGWGMSALLAEATALPLPDKPSIAVLPFDNMSGDPEQEYFSDGISEDIITALSNVHWLFVIARNSTFTYKGAPVDVTRVARELGVRYVLEGSVRKAGNKVRITAQLADGNSGSHVWAERYDRKLEDIFALQDEITETIVGRIDSELRMSERDRARRKPPANLNAWDLYQRGLWHFYRVAKEDNEKARDFFLKAVEWDPNFALAHAGIAFTCYMEVFHDFSSNPDEWLAQGLTAGERAVALDQKDSFTHFVLGRVLSWAGQGDRAIAELEQSVTLSPSFALGYFGLGMTLNWYGRAADAIPRLKMAMRLSPQDTALWAMQSATASSYNDLGQYDEGVAWGHKAVSSRADLIWTHLCLADALAGQDRLDEAGAAIAAVRRIKPDLSQSLMRRLLPHYHSEYIERLIGALAKAGLPE